MKKAKEVQKTPEQIKQAEIDALRKNYFITPPSLHYKIGERVQRGAIDKAVVTDIIDGGKIICLHEWCTDTNYGRPKQYERDSVVPWYQLQPYREDNKEYPLLSPPDSDRIIFFQTSLEGVIHRYYNAGVDLDPPYQRGIVWEDSNRQALLDSIFMYADIGKFVFARGKYSDNKLYEIIDGKQRFITLLDYMESRWAWRGKLFKDLNRLDQYHIKNYLVSVADLQEPSFEQKLKVFLRVNTTGVPMESSHLDRVKALLEK